MLHNLVSVSYWLEGGSSQAHSSLFELSFAAYFLVRGNLLTVFVFVPLSDSEERCRAAGVCHHVQC